MDHSKVEPLFLKMRDLPPVVGLSRAEIYRQVVRGTFPTPVSLGGRNKAWSMQTIKVWAAAREAAALEPVGA